MSDEKNIINNISPVNASANLNVSVDATESLNKVTDSALELTKPPAKKSSEIVTGLLSFISETIDTGLYIYRENLNYYKEKCHAKVKAKIDSIPKEHLTTADIGIVGETLENLKYNMDKDYLVELYSNIIARNVDDRTKDSIHPAFISIIKDLSYNDIKFLQALYKYQNADHIFIPIISLSIGSNSDQMNKTFKTNRYFISLENYEFELENLGLIIENLVKLNLISIDFMNFLSDASIYESLKEKANALYKPTFKSLETIYNCECNIEIKSKGLLSLTNLGQSLLNICLS